METNSYARGDSIKKYLIITGDEVIHVSKMLEFSR
jgi:hypothetical protein